MGELVNYLHSKGMLNLTVDFLMASLDALMCMYAVSYFVLLVPVREGKYECFWSIQGDVFSDPLISLPDAMNPIGACSPGCL